MRDLLEMVFEYRRLLARSEATDGNMTQQTEARLRALENLFGREPSVQGAAPRRHARCDVKRTATLRVGDRVQAVSVVNLGGGGVCVSPAPNLAEGQRAVLRVVGDDQQTVYQYPVRAHWTRRGEDSSQMGMPFVGRPSVEGRPTTKRAPQMAYPMAA